MKAAAAAVRGKARAAAPVHRGVPVAWVQVAMVLASLIAKPLADTIDNDFWWHLKTGELIFESGIPRSDPFSWTASGREWVAHEWLSEAIIYAVQSTLGYGANVLLFGSTVAGALALMYGLGRRSGAGTRPLVGLLLISAMIVSLAVTVRPQIFTWLLFAVFLYVIQRRYEGHAAPVWALPPLMAVWANLHLGFVYGLMLAGAWVAASAWDRAHGRRHELGLALAVGGACLLASTLNPHGPLILWYPFRYLYDAQATHAHVMEWRPPTPLAPWHYPTFVAVLLLCASLGSRQRPRPFLILVTAGVCVLALSAVRNAPFAALLLLPVAGAAAAARWPAARDANDSKLRVSPPVAAGLVAFVAVLVVGVASRNDGTFSFGAPSERGYPVAGAAYVREHEAGRRLLAEYGWGGYLIHELNPETKVFIDGRSDFYGNALLEDYIMIYGMRRGWEELLDQYRVEVVLISREAPLAEGLAASVSWQRAFEGGAEVVYTRR